jgi:hypothetical protein
LQILVRRYLNKAHRRTEHRTPHRLEEMLGSGIFAKHAGHGQRPDHGTQRGRRSILGGGTIPMAPAIQAKLLST